MTDNASKMTLEEKLVQSIKDTSLFALVGDEDALLQLTKRALDEALFQPRRVPKSYGSYDTKDSPLVEAARNFAHEALEKIRAKYVQQLLEDEQFKTLFFKALSHAIPAMITNSLYELQQRISTDAAVTAAQHVQSYVESKS